MKLIPIYKAEADLSEEIQKNNVISYANTILPVKGTDWKKTLLRESLIQKIEKEYKSVAKIDDVDLFPLSSILVSAGWNKNDDVFTHNELFAARHTPEDKPFNYMHDGTDIIGHIVANILVDQEYKSINNINVVDDLPELFHILTHAVLYKKWSDANAQERIDNIINNLDKWFVSMECLFTDFDYAIKKANNQSVIINRNSSTAHLTKYLRVYGGSGVYNDDKIGRLLKNITFAGKGLVNQPANPYSIIFSDTQKFAPVIANEGLVSSVNMGEKVMPDETQDLLKKQNAEQQLKIDALTSQVEELKSKLSDSNTETLKAEIVKLKDVVSAKDEVVEQLKSELDKTGVEKADISKQLTEATASVADLKQKLSDIESQRKQEIRIATLVKVGKTEDVAKTLAEKFVKLDDETFAVIVENLKVTKIESNDVEADPNEVNANTQTLENTETNTEADLNVNTETADDLKSQREALAAFVEKKFLRRNKYQSLEEVSNGS